MCTVIKITAPLIWVVYYSPYSPLKKASILSATPKKAGATNFGKSLRSIFLFGVKMPNNQKSNPAQMTLNKINPKGLTCPPTITSLANVKVSP